MAGNLVVIERNLKSSLQWIGGQRIKQFRLFTGRKEHVRYVGA